MQEVRGSNPLVSTILPVDGNAGLHSSLDSLSLAQPNAVQMNILYVCTPIKGPMIAQIAPMV